MKKTAATVRNFHNIDACIEQLRNAEVETPVFMLPSWLKAWLQAFSPDTEPCIYVVSVKEKAIGFAPLLINRGIASFIGGTDVCDYMDFALLPGYEKEFYNALLDELLERNVAELDLRCLRPESTVLSHLIHIVRERGAMCSIEPDEVSVEMDLPADWGKYLNMLDGRQRHEVRRKFRKLHQSAKVRFTLFQDAGEIFAHLDEFLKMFRESRTDKAVFMNPQMESFFRSMIKAMSKDGIVHLYVLELNDAPAAACICFDYKNTMYLYNSGYDPRYSSLSAGLLCKILSIKHSIELGRKKYDFLKGAEPYKYRLGGKEVHLSRCRISFN